jgi:hypothetical protein
MFNDDNMTEIVESLHIDGCSFRTLCDLLKEGARTAADAAADAPALQCVAPFW